MSSQSSLIPSYSFSVMFDIFKFGFSKVTNISGSAEIETIINGGQNDSPVILRKPKRNPDTLIFERGLHSSVSDTAFTYFSEGRKIDSITINVMLDGKIVRTFFVGGGIIIRREYAPLDAMGSAVFLEALQVAHSGITEVAMPF